MSASSPHADEKKELDPFYINQRRVLLLAADQERHEPPVLARGGSSRWQELADVARAARMLRRWLSAQVPTVRTLEELLAKNEVSRGHLFTTFRDFYCRDVQRGKAPLVHAKYEGVSAPDVTTQLHLRVHRDHVVSGSPASYLSGRVSDLFVVGIVDDIEGETIIANPLFIGRWMRGATPMQTWLSSTERELVIDVFDSFERVRNERDPSTRELEILRGIPENDVKHAFARIIGEPDVPKDWGGERSDLFTSYLRLEERRTTAAFLFKGPARFHPMTLADLGKNGDQIDRLYTEPADVIFVQHCHRITPPVRTLLRAMCNQVGSSKRFCLVTGYDTLRVLRAYGECGQSSRPKPPPREPREPL